MRTQNWEEQPDQLPAIVEYQQNNCPMCGGREFEWGRVQSFYVPGSSMWSTRGRQVVKARRCLRCNNLLQFTDAAMSRQQSRGVIIIVIIALVFSVAIAVLSIVLAVSNVPH
jgi:hypothetical protein